MRAAYLSSYRIPHPTFLEGIAGSFKDRKIAIITNAKDDRLSSEAEPKIISLENYLGSLGLVTSRLDLCEFKNQSAKLTDEVSDIDFLYGMGGSSNHLIQAMLGCGFRTVLNEFNGFYIGESAGAMALGGTYGLVNDYLSSINSKKVLQDGIGIIDQAIVPHVDSQYEEKFRDRGAYMSQAHGDNPNVVLLRDDEAVIVVEGVLTRVEEIV